MGQINIPDKSPGDSYPATEWNTVKAEHNDTDSRVSAIEGSNTVNVSDLSDLPAPVSGVITLVDSTIYIFTGNVDIGANRLVVGSDNLITGRYAELDSITSTTAGAIITTTNNSFKVKDLRINATSSTGLDLNGTSAENVLFARFTLVAGSLGSCNDYSVFDVNQANFVSLGGGITLSGAMFAVSLQGGAFYSESGIGLDLNGLTADIIQISRMYFNNNNSSIGINVAAGGANLNADSIGAISYCSFLDPANSTSGYSPLDVKWSVDFNQNNSIIPSDRFQPTGWGAYADGETAPATQTFNTTPSKLQIDGAGAGTEENYLPLSIRGTGSLWDSVNDKITPISIGDSYDIRINLEVTGKTSSPNVLTMEVDIGGGGSPTIVIVPDDKSVTKAPPYNLVYTFPIYDLTTFFTNGAQIFLSTDVGSLTIGARNISIFRTSSGAS